MSMLHLLGEEEIREDSLQQYFSGLYKVVCVSDRVEPSHGMRAPVRSTYVVDWEQLVHLLEDYEGFGEDIVEVARIGADEGNLPRSSVPISSIARA